MAKKNPPRHRTDLSRGQAAVYFLRLVERQRDKRRGISNARLAVDPKQFREIIRRLFTYPAYRWAAVGEPFPAAPEAIQKKLQLQKGTLPCELIWSAEILAVWADELKQFVAQRTKYESHFLNGHYEQASTTLDEIEKTFGWSIWLVASRIQLLAISKGLQAQKQFLEGLLARDITPLFGWVSYYCSLRSEENYSLKSIQEVLDDTRGYPDLFDYATYHLNPYQITQIGDASNLLWREEVNPLIDRLHAHVVAARVLLSRQLNDHDRRAVVDSLETLRAIEDPAIERLLGVTAQGPLDGFDSYLRQDTDAIAVDESASAEVRALGLFGGNFPTSELESSVVNQAARCMVDMLVPNGSYLKGRQQLQKLALTCGHLSLTREIASFVARQDATTSADEDFEPPQRYAAIASDIRELSLPTFFGAESAHSEMADPADQSLAAKTVLALRHRDQTLLPKQISNTLLPLYNAEIAFKAGNLDLAQACFDEGIGSSNRYAAAVANVGLFRCAMQRGDTALACRLAVTHSLLAPDTYRLYPFDRLATLVSGRSSTIDPLLKAVLLQFAFRMDPRWGSELSDAYENTLSHFGVERPSELSGFGSSALERFFLQHVCAPRFIEDSTAFSSVEEIENERIAVCQRLLEVDPSNAALYSEEIKTITRDQNVSALLQHVESNMVYVDTAGVYSVVHDNLRESFERYKVLISSPSLDYQAEQISRMIKELITKLGTERKDIAAPASSEKTGLLEQMRNYFIDVFALNPAYGLDTNLSTSIRHGVIEGHIRAPYVEEQLLCDFDAATKTWVLPERWREKLESATQQDRFAIEKAFTRFTTRVNELVRLYRDDFIRIRRVDLHKEGLFYFKPTTEELTHIADLVTPSTTYEEFLALLLEHAWSLVDRSMAEIKARIRGDLLNSLTSATETLARSLTEIQAAKAAGFMDSIARAQTRMQMKAEEIANWFRRPTDVANTPFDLELAFLVALKQVENCYTGKPLSERARTICVDKQFDGSVLNGLVEVLFLFLQNAVKHGGFHLKGKETPLKINAFEIDHELILEFENEISADLDLEELKLRATEALALNSAADLEMARIEGRSGLLKLERLMRFDLRKEYLINFEFTDDRRFKATLKFDTQGLTHADLHH